jgi:UDP-N-acetylmuramoyl-L-alanyl-D-glutamate--2,6-diaminopimelate ligase
MQLRELLHHIECLKVEGPLDQEVTGLAYDSRRVTPGMVFVAVRGATADGHDYIPSALDRGAAAVVCERNNLGPSRAARIKVANARCALAQASAAFYDHPSRELKVVGVTGTNGKTTVSFLTQAVCGAAGLPAGLIGTVRYEIGERVIPALRTTPESLETQHMMAQMVRSGCRACVMEVSSHALEQGRVDGVAFDVAVFTNLTRDHLDFHGTMEAYFEAKARLFRLPPGAPKATVAVVNVDDAYGRRLVQRTDLDRIVTYGTAPDAMVRAEAMRLDRDGITMRVLTPGGSLECHTRLIGRHNVQNVLAAVGGGVALSVPEVVMQAAFEKVEAVPGRLERVACGQPFHVFVDYAHTDDALRHVLTTLREITPGRLLLAFGCGGSRDSGKRPEMGRVAATLADWTVVTSDNPRREPAASIAADILTGYRDVRPEGCEVELERRRAIELVLRRARAGDAVLIAGKGHETYQEFADTVVPFDDRETAREVLRGLGFGPGAGRAFRNAGHVR